jgi:hypothetical protein
VHDEAVRWLILIIMLAASTADARRLVISDPPMVRKCPKGKTWNEVVTCLGKHYQPKVTKEVKGAKLVTLFQKAGDGKLIDSGVLLYIERNGAWQIGGRFETYGGEYTVFGLAPITIGKASGFKLDIGQATPISVMVETTPVPALQRMHRTMFCNGDSYSCPEATTSCDVSVDGGTWYLFRGTLTYEDNQVSVAGDRERAGPYCNVSPKVYLGWVRR